MIQKIWFKDYRNLKDTVFELNQNRHIVIIGENNQGKSNFLEGIFLASRGQTPTDNALECVIRGEAEQSVLGLDFIKENETHRLYIKIHKDGKKSYQYNQKEVKTIKSLKNDLLIEFLSADVLRLLQDEPDCRRKELDVFCTLLFPDYLQTMSSYTKILRQKNTSLKAGDGQNYLQIWNKQLADYGEKIVKNRKEAIQKIKDHMISISKTLDLFFSDHLSVEYKINRIHMSEKSYKEDFYAQLLKDEEKEKILGYTLSGPQRDDFVIKTQNKTFQDFYSRGINRMAAILFKIAQWSILTEKNQTFPILLLDDVFAELDTKNREILIRYLKEKTKVIYATVQKEDILFFDNASVFHMKGGELHEVG